MERLVRSTSPTAHFASANLVRHRSLGLLPPNIHRQQDRELLPSRAFSALGFEASHSTRRFESKTSKGQYAASHNSYEASPTSVGLAGVRGGDDKPKLIWVRYDKLLGYSMTRMLRCILDCMYKANFVRTKP
jgi:hypothetical protein